MYKKHIIVVLVMSIILLSPIKSYAEINGPERAILGLLAPWYEKDGHYWSVKAEYDRKASRYCDREDVDLTWSDYEQAKDAIYGYVGPEYFDCVGDVPGYVDPSAPVEPEIPEDILPPKKDVSENDVSENDVSENDVSENDISENDISKNDISTNGSGKENIEIVKVPDDYVSDVSGSLDEILNPSKDYSNQEPIKKQAPLGMIAGAIIVVTVLVSALIIFFHRRNGRKRF